MEGYTVYHLGNKSKMSDNHFYSYVAAFNDNNEKITPTAYAKFISTSSQNINALIVRLVKNGWMENNSDGLFAIKRDEAQALTEEFNKARKAL